LLCVIRQDENLLQVRAERSETTEPLAATTRRASEASHPARPTNVERRPKGAFLLCVIRQDETSDSCTSLQTSPLISFSSSPTLFCR